MFRVLEHNANSWSRYNTWFYKKMVGVDPKEIRQEVQTQIRNGQMDIYDSMSIEMLLTTLGQAHPYLLVGWYLLEA
jgi:hypothetical protein